MRALLLGLCLAVLARTLTRVPTARLEGPPAVPPRSWLADRDGHVVVRLDGELGRRAELEVAWPARVCPTSDGGAWIASAPGRGRAEDPRAPWRLLRLDAGGRTRIELGLPGLWDLEPDSRGNAWALWGDPPRLARLEAADAPLELPAGARRIALDARWALVGFEAGQVLRLDPRRLRPARWIQVAAPVLDLAPDARGGWWILDGLGVLHRLDRELESLWSGGVPLEEPRLARGAVRAQVWVVDRARGAAVRVDPWGRGWWSEPLPLAGVECARALPDGGLLAAGGGAVVRLDPAGHVQVGQGGFAFVADL